MQGVDLANCRFPDSAFAARPIRELNALLVSSDTLAQFVAMPFSDLHSLHDGNIARYRLWLPEYRTWRGILVEGCPNDASGEFG